MADSTPAPQPARTVPSRPDRSEHLTLPGRFPSTLERMRWHLVMKPAPEKDGGRSK
ncbi:MAG: hypothetical protein PW734_02490 [Verrucomicrobium sp.]|nr:hypothetical protein [Verrucomicrobium sp.]